ncbi:N-acetylmuramoyl-L-alanine amidase [Microtetraspora fusca]|uniref:N-acetylmuramoyl-L-alanine amidase n=1 Tax=Microtetraspora fusca TaxID=1997 RepID=A0ABW6VF53_MICFU
MRMVKARWSYKGRIAPIRVIVIHSAEVPEVPAAAENVARYFATTDVQASAHVCVDNDSAVRCLPDVDTAWAAPGCNADGLQVELAGYASQSRAQWLDTYSRGVLDQAARVVADWCLAYDIPPRRLTRAELKAGKRGITCHADVSAVYKRSDHTDPGEGFPWDVFMDLVAVRVRDAGGETKGTGGDEESKFPAWPKRQLRLTRPRIRGVDVRVWQRQMRQRGWSIAVDGVFGPRCDTVCRSFQQQKGLAVDGIVGPITWDAAWTSPVT